jgi:hypothetical protein
MGQWAKIFKAAGPNRDADLIWHQQLRVPLLIATLAAKKSPSDCQMPHPATTRALCSIRL